MTATNRILNADLIRVLAMLLVIVLHTILNFTIRTDFFPSKLWWMFEPIVALAKTSVLLFLMLSGYLVIAKQRNLSANFKQTYRKIIIPLGCFSLLNLGYDWLKLSSHSQTFDWGAFSLQQLQKIVTFPSSPLWFLSVLLFLYLLNPIWQLIFQAKEKAILVKFLLLSSLFFPS